MVFDLFFRLPSDFIAFRMKFSILGFTGQHVGRRRELWWAVIGLYNKELFFFLLVPCVQMLVLVVLVLSTSNVHFNECAE